MASPVTLVRCVGCGTPLGQDPPNAAMVEHAATCPKHPLVPRLAAMEARAVEWEERCRRVEEQANRQLRRADAAESDLAALRAAVEALAGEWEAQREEFADADEDDCCAAVIGSFVRELRLLLPGGDDDATGGRRP